MRVKYIVSISFTGAEIDGEVEIDDKELEGLTEDERHEKITDLVWEDSLQYVVMPWKIVKEVIQT